MADNQQFAVAIGTSTGGVEALLRIAAVLPRDFPAIILVTQHIGNHASMLPQLMRSRGENHAVHPFDGEKPLPGTIYIAPPDHHMLVERDCIRLVRGPKENYCRPAIDPMFRSVAMAFGTRAIGVVLTGQLDDGTAGLGTIKECGGIAVVQDPSTASEPGMPASALANVEVDHCVRVEEIVPALERIVFGAGRVRQVRGVPEAPQDSRWTTVRSLQQKELLLRRLARVARLQGDHAQADAGERQADVTRERANGIARLIEKQERSA